MGGGHDGASRNLKGSHPKEGLANLSNKEPTILGFVGLAVSVTTTQLCCRTEAAGDGV